MKKEFDDFMKNLESQLKYDAETITSVFALPEHIQIYAEYLMKDGRRTYEKVEFVGMMKSPTSYIETYPVLMLVDNEGVFRQVDDFDDFLKLHFRKDCSCSELPEGFA